MESTMFKVGDRVRENRQLAKTYEVLEVRGNMLVLCKCMDDLLHVSKAVLVERKS